MAPHHLDGRPNQEKNIGYWKEFLIVGLCKWTPISRLIQSHMGWGESGAFGIQAISYLLLIYQAHPYGLSSEIKCSFISVFNPFSYSYY